MFAVFKTLLRVNAVAVLLCSLLKLRISPLINLIELVRRKMAVQISSVYKSVNSGDLANHADKFSSICVKIRRLVKKNSTDSQRQGENM